MAGNLNSGMCSPLCSDVCAFYLPQGLTCVIIRGWNVSAENVCLLFCIVILYFRVFDHMCAGGYLPDCVSCLTCVWRWE